MLSIFSIFVAMLGVMLPSALAIDGYVENHCSFPIYIWTDGNGCGQGSCSSPIWRIDGLGGAYKVPFQPVPDSSGGISVKFGLDPSDKNQAGRVYQAEYSVAAGEIWYNWSHVDGAPLQNVRRSMTVGGGGECPQSICEAGSDSCDWYAANGLEYNVFKCGAMDIVMRFCQ
jgi:hypothetical protein